MADPDPPASPPTAGAPAPDGSAARSIPRDGGTLLGAAVALGFLAALSHQERFHLGAGPIPIWVPLALDTAIAGACGAVLLLGGRWFEEVDASAPAGSVLVAKPVWESIQREVLSARAQSRGALPPPEEPAPVSPTPATAPSGPNPWDEGPPIRPPIGAPSPAVAVAAPAGPPPAPGASRTETAASVPATLVAPATAPSPRPSAPASGPNPAPAVASPGAASAPASAGPELSTAELEQIARMGGVLGVVPLKGESSQSYSRRLARAREALAGAPSPTPPPEPWIETPPAQPASGSGASADIDELMNWLEELSGDAGSKSPTDANPPDPKKKTTSNPVDPKG